MGSVVGVGEGMGKGISARSLFFINCSQQIIPKGEKPRNSIINIEKVKYQSIQLKDEMTDFEEGKTRKGKNGEDSTSCGRKLY